jgi:sucrose phosphorylase
LVSYKHNSDGSQSPYELNISYFDALSDPNASEPRSLQVLRFLAAHAIQLALVGVPGIYFHSLFGSRSWQAGVLQTGRSRSINREKFDLASLENALGDPQGLRRMVFTGLSHLLKVRAGRSAFHPNGKQVVIDAGPAIFAVWRIAPHGKDQVLCLQNVSVDPQPVPAEILPASAIDYLTGQGISPSETGQPLVLTPYQSLWLG